MRRLFGLLLVSALALGTTSATAQPPGNKGDKGGDKGGRGGEGRPVDPEAMVKRLMSFDKNKDGKLSKDEMTDERLKAMFDRIDTDKKGVVTKEQITAFFTKEAAAGAQGPGGPGGPPGGGPGGPGGRMGPPKPGVILPPQLQDELKMTDAQKKQLEELQKEVDAKLAKILTDAQKQQIKEMGNRGPGGPGGPGGPPGGGPGGPPGAPPGGNRPPN